MSGLLQNWQEADGFNPRKSVLKLCLCSKHNWAAVGVPCPKCMNGDAPTECPKHGWSHLDKGCPECQAGR